jgi:LmbE family N-acetylglucosaminyl deacetylase
VVVAHSDDEALGCGGTIARHSEAGDRVVAISMTDGVGARSTSDEPDAARRRDAAAASARELGFDWLPGGSFPDNQLDTVPLLEVARLVEDAKREAQPDIVYTHHGGDLNVDHRIVLQAVLTAFRPVPGEAPVEIRSFEVASSTEWSHESVGTPFHPDLYIGISDTWDKKQASLEAYAEEMRDPPHARSVEGLRHLAALRGHQVGLPLAEAFVTVRRVLP